MDMEDDQRDDNWSRPVPMCKVDDMCVFYDADTLLGWTLGRVCAIDPELEGRYEVHCYGHHSVKRSIQRNSVNKMPFLPGYLDELDGKRELYTAKSVSLESACYKPYKAWFPAQAFLLGPVELRSNKLSMATLSTLQDRARNVRAACRSSQPSEEQ